MDTHRSEWKYPIHVDSKHLPVIHPEIFRPTCRIIYYYSKGHIARSQIRILVIFTVRRMPLGVTHFTLLSCFGHNIICPHQIPHTDILVLPFTMPLRHCLSGRAFEFKILQPPRTLTCISFGGQLMLVPQS